MREPISSFVFENPRSRLRGKPAEPKSRRVGKGYGELGSYEVREWLMKVGTYVRDWQVRGRT